MNVFELVAKIGLDSSGFDKGISDAGSKFSSFGRSLASGAGAIASGIATGVTAATTAMVAFSATAVKSGMSFDSSMAQVAATMGVTVDEIGTLRDFAQQMGATTAFSATEAADALNYMALAGYDAETSMQMLPNVLNLAAAGNIDLAYASDMVTDSQSALGLSLSETSTLVDQMAATASKSNTSVEQLGEAILQVGGTAKIMAGGTTELSAALGILADNGVKGAEGGTALRNVLTTLAGSKFDKTFGAMGVAVYDASGEMRSMKDILADMNTVMADMTTEERTGLINETFNARDLKNVNALLATSTDRWDQLTGAIDGSAGAAQRMAETQLDTLEGDITILKSAFEGAQIALSDNLTPSLRNFVQLGTEGLTALTSAFKTGDFSGATKAISDILVQGLNAISSALPSAVSAGADILKGILSGIASNAGEIARSAGDIVKTFIGAILNIIPEVLPEIIIALAEVIPELVISIGEMLYESAPAFVEAGRRLFGAIPEGFFEELPQMIMAGAQALGDFLANLTAQMPQFLQVGVGMASEITQGLISGITTLVSAVSTVALSVVSSFFAHAPEFFQVAIDLLFQVAQGFLASLPDILACILEIVAGIINIIATTDWLAVGQTIITAIRDGVFSLFNMLPELFMQIMQVAIEFVMSIDWAGLGLNIINTIWGMINSLFYNIPNLLLSIGNSAWTKFKSINWRDLGGFVVSFIVNSLTAVFSDIGNKLVEIGNDAWDRFKNIDWLGLGKAVIDGIVEGVTKFGSSLITSILDLCSGAYDAVKDFFGISSPSKLMKNEVGKFLPLGMAEGIKENAGAVIEAMDSISYIPSFSMDTTDGMASSGAGNNGLGERSGSFGDIVINITSNENPRAIAEEVSQLLSAEYNRRKAIWQPI